MKNLEELKNYILSNIDENWTNLEKIRYAYIESGKYLQKYNEFFLTLDNKLTKTALSSKELDRIYENKKKKKEWNMMICKSGSEFLKDVLDELSIESKLVETIPFDKYKGMKNEIHHFFLVVNVGSYNIFLVPVADYPYIQANITTKHFGTNVPFIVDDKQYYKSDKEIPHRILSKKTLKKIDDKIGYTVKIVSDSKSIKKNDYIDTYIKNNKNMYLDFLAMNTEFYNYIIPENENDRIINSLSDNRFNWNKMINNICYRVGLKIGEITNHKYIYNDHVVIYNFNDWVNYVTSLFNKDDYNEKEVYYSNPDLLFNKTKALCELIIKFNKDTEKKPEDVKRFRFAFIRLIKEISKHFIDRRYLIEPKDKDKYVSNVYINHKFSTFFPYLMNANSGFKEDFNYRAYNEQIEEVKQLIMMMFMDLTSSNLFEKPDLSFKYSPIFKRINIFSIRKRNDEGYGFYAAITDSEANHISSSYWYKYDFSENVFEKTTLSKIVLESSKNGKYEILSNRLKSVIDLIELEGEYSIGRKK